MHIAEVPPLTARTEPFAGADASFAACAENRSPLLVRVKCDATQISRVFAWWASKHETSWPCLHLHKCGVMHSVFTCEGKVSIACLFKPGRCAENGPRSVLGVSHTSNSNGHARHRAFRSPAKRLAPFVPSNGAKASMHFSSELPAHAKLALDACKLLFNAIHAQLVTPRTAAAKAVDGIITCEI